MIDITAHLPASLEAIKQEAALMFGELERHRARLFVQQIANKHSDDDVFELRPPDGKAITYAERVKELDEVEENLKAGLPPAVVEAIQGNTTNGKT